VALIGPNGSGKTTLLNIISGLVKPDQGSIHLQGRRIDRLPAYRIARQGIGRSFQELSVFNDLSVQDNVYVVKGDASFGEINQIMKHFGLTDGNSPCDSLSYGAKKSLDLARLFVKSESLHLVLLDEPTAGLTQQEAIKAVQVISHLCKQTGLAMIIVSHDVM